MNTVFSSRIVLGIAAATTSLVLMAGCDRKPGDTGSMSNDRTAPPAVQDTPATPMSPAAPSTPGMPPASDPAAPAAPAAPPPGGSGTTQ